MWLRWKDGNGKEDCVRNIAEMVSEEGMWLRWKDGKGKSGHCPQHWREGIRNWYVVGGRMGNEREDFVRDIGERVRG